MRLFRKHPTDWCWNRSVIPATLQDIRQAAEEFGYALIPLQPEPKILCAGNFRKEFSYPRKGMMVSEYRWDYESYEAMIKAAEAAE